MDTHSDPAPWASEDIVSRLERRLGRVHARQRMGIERDWEAHIFGHGLNFFHIENWNSIHALMGLALKLGGLYWRGRRNAENIQVRDNPIRFATLPAAFDGFTILHLSDLHVEMNPPTLARLIALVEGLDYDLCVLTGDLRADTFGPFDKTLAGLARLRDGLRGAVLAPDQLLDLAPQLADHVGIRVEPATHRLPHGS